MQYCTKRRLRGLVVLLALSACQRPDASNVTGEAAPVCTTCVEMELLAVLGTVDDEGFLSTETRDVVVDPEGRFWVGQRGEIKIYDAGGGYLRTVGRSGEGPLEFGWARPNHVDGLGQIHVVDDRNLRESVITPAGELVEERRLPAAPLALVPTINGSGRLVANMWYGIPEAMGEPLHLIDGSTVVRSFGARPEDGPATPVTIERVLGSGVDGAIYSAHPYEYRIEAWTPDLEKSWTFEGPALNDPPHVRGPFAPDNPPPNRLWAVQDDEDTGLLIVLLWERRPGWQESMVEVTTPDGSIVYQPSGPDVSYADMYAGKVELIDPGSGSVVASFVTDPLFTAFAGRRLAVEAREIGGAPQVGIWQLTLTDPRR